MLSLDTKIWFDGLTVGQVLWIWEYDDEENTINQEVDMLLGEHDRVKKED